MAEEHFNFASGLGAVPFFGSGPYAPAPALGLDVAAMAPFGMPPWASAELLPLPSDSAAAAHFDSSLSSLVSSPAGGDDVAAIGDLIGRLGSICSNAAGSANNSCYSTPLSSPPRGASPAVAFRHLEAGGGGRLSRVASSKSFGGAAEAAETSPTAAAGDKAETPAAPRKRKVSGKGKAAANGSPKRSKLVAAGDGDENGDAAAEEGPEPVKDYIHVRARRGQATDSHSLAERVRREKISERMKLLQSIVPGCNKITGKALMLDEIINYVQSLQRQVEFLSMKLSTMNPELDVDAQYLPSSDKDMTMLGYPSHHDGAAAFSYADPFAVHHPAMESCAAGFAGGWDTAAQDLQSIVHRHDHHHGGQQQEEEAEAEAATVMSHMKAEP